MNTTTTPIRVTELAFTAYPVTDLPRARAFYEELLGLNVTSKYESPDGSWIEYDVGGHTLAITNCAKEWVPANQGPSLALEVEDFDATIAHLKQAGVTFTVEPFASPMCRLAVFLDSEGNALCVHKRNCQCHG